MSQPKRSTAVPASVEQQLEMSAALARERLMEVHFRYAMELIEHVRDEIDPGRALGIYTRLHGLRGEDANTLYQRVFVALGRRTRRPFAHGAADSPDEWETPDTIIGVIRRRLRGRVNRELRQWVEFHTGRAETELLWAHVENSLEFADLLQPHVGVGEAVAYYTDALRVPHYRRETVYYLALAHLSPEPAPALVEPTAASAERAGRLFAAAAPDALRVVGSRRGSRRRTPS
jgi:hypothetical protein